MKKLFFIIGVGSIPLWVVFFITLIHGVSIATHWYVIIAIPFCVTLMIIASIAVFIYSSTNGNKSLKFVRAGIIFVTLIVIFVGIETNKWWKHNKIEQAIKKETLLVQEYVKHNEEVIQKARGVRNVFLYTYKRKSKTALPYRYIMSVWGLDKQSREKDLNSIYVAVDVSRQDDIAKFTLACFLPSSGHSGPLKTKCE